MGTEKYEGRLELTWTNKHLRLLAQDDGTYEWVNPADYRVAEVRLLHSTAAIGKVGSESSRARDNLLIKGDALNALTSLAQLPEFASEYLGKVKLVYLDPPFNTQQSFLQYDDALEHSVWLTMMRDRVLQIRDLLSEDGSLWIHCDDSEHAYLKVMLDEIFGRGNFIANVLWQKMSTRENRTDVSTVHDYLVAYARDRRIWGEHRNLLPFGAEQTERFQNPDDDPRGPWASLPAHGKAGKGRRAAQFYTITVPSGRNVDPPPGRCWVYVRERFDEKVADNRIWFGRDGDAVPRIKVFLSEVEQGLVPTTWWIKDEVGTTAEAKKEIVALFPDETPFATPKPERLLHRIIHVASNPGDVVLDCFLGSGTAAAVAQKMGRRWVGVERESETIERFAAPRLKLVIGGQDPGGVTEQTAWEGGGGLRVLEVAHSMFEADGGLVFLAEWMTNGALAEATAAQLGYKYEDDPPFAGRKGRTRLAVVDGVVNESVVRLLTGALADNERLVVCGTAIDPDVRALLKDLRPGSTMRKIPAALLARYRQSNQLRFEISATNPIEGNGRPSRKKTSQQRRKVAT